MDKIHIIRTTDNNIDQYAICGYKNPKTESFRRKSQWIKEQFKIGLRYNILYSEEKGSIGGIEYIPGEYAWRPVEANGYLFIHCIYIIAKPFKGKGYGQKLVQSCIDDANANQLKGVAVVTRKGTWMASSDLFRRLDFKRVDILAPDFELWVLQFDENSNTPKFIDSQTIGLNKFSNGLTIVHSDQCPYLVKTTPEIIQTASGEFGFEPTVIKLNSHLDAQKLPCGYGTCAIIMDGKVVSDKPTSNTRFKNIINKYLKP